MDNTRKVKMFLVDPAGFMQLFTEGLEVKKRYRIVKGLPRDAKLMTIINDPLRGGLVMVVESSEFPDVPREQMPPLEPIEIELLSN